ncbi:PREDICTED: beta-1,3-galactosyltransferase 1-like [Priapulus caudatus]|uniref:Hexosyltransferase n=1 Tax=Priapulus caudatus TaxID=37621 RepID=A0ABM1EUB2_PRICU|nr:PREDICTED: beta-1,3-galactosyltransferase 1-like [Priapulus caudatus]
MRASAARPLPQRDPPGVPNPHNFSYLLNEEDMCERDGDDLFMIVYVHTAPSHYRRRMAIRETWAHERWLRRLRFRVVFFLGVPSDDATTQSALAFESGAYRDLVQEDFRDTYRNLTYKGVGALRWVARHCSRARWVLKTDDDIVVNVFALHAHLTSVARHGHAPVRAILCHVWGRMPVLRTGKWEVAERDYAGKYFPQYCSGSAFLITPDAVVALYNASLYTPFFWVDDVYVTGYLPSRADVRRVSIASTYVFKQEQLERGVLNATHPALFAHVRRLADMYTLWSKLLTMRGETLPPSSPAPPDSAAAVVRRVAR